MNVTWWSEEEEVREPRGAAPHILENGRHLKYHFGDRLVVAPNRGSLYAHIFKATWRQSDPPSGWRWGPSTSRSSPTPGNFRGPTWRSEEYPPMVDMTPPPWVGTQPPPGGPPAIYRYIPLYTLYTPYIYTYTPYISTYTLFHTKPPTPSPHNSPK